METLHFRRFGAPRFLRFDAPHFRRFGALCFWHFGALHFGGAPRSWRFGVLCLGASTRELCADYRRWITAIGNSIIPGRSVTSTARHGRERLGGGHGDACGVRGVA
ncbi:hypothetical protein [Dactylosporangium matsuzakiense]|uniref:hypothetical protein n=1 Tax=Dactylosporangium matsuzakiense TaxID=53360 RepID=UPI0021C26B6E|nr:hypothetical protein [Dactylosporangium matsuzakiense]UWZ49067.1 hypothetical protein Dmats_23335 [Dactylosporangium matsuzakiense]